MAMRHNRIEVRPYSHVHELADEIWFNIYSFLLEEEEDNVTGVIQRSMSLGGLYRILAVVSKDDQSRLMRYVQQVPHSFVYDKQHANLLQFEWACRNRIKIDKLDFRTCDSIADRLLCLNMLKTCSLTELTTFKDRTFWFSNSTACTTITAGTATTACTTTTTTTTTTGTTTAGTRRRRTISCPRTCTRSRNNNNRQAARFGVPLEEITTTTNGTRTNGNGPSRTTHINILSTTDIQRETIKLLSMNAPILRKICIESKKHKLYLPLLTALPLSNNIQDLTLKLFEGGTRTRSGKLDHDLEQITHAVEHMPHLKKLKLNACFPASFQIRSNSLTKVDVRGCLQGFWVDLCVCPNLQIFRMSYHMHKRGWTGAIPIDKHGIQNDLEDSYWKRGSFMEDYTAKGLPCAGLFVPDSCNMSLFIFNL